MSEAEVVTEMALGAARAAQDTARRGNLEEIDIPPEEGILAKVRETISDLLGGRGDLAEREAAVRERHERALDRELKKLETERAAAIAEAQRRERELDPQFQARVKQAEAAWEEQLKGAEALVLLGRVLGNAKQKCSVTRKEAEAALEGMPAFSDVSTQHAVWAVLSILAGLLK